MGTVEIYSEFDDGLSLKVTRYPIEDKMRILEILKRQPSCWNYLGEDLDNWLPEFCHLEVSESQEHLWSALFVAGFGSPIICFYSQTEEAIFLQSYIKIYKLEREEGRILNYYEAEDGQILGIFRANDGLIVWQEQAIVKLDFRLHPLCSLRSASNGRFAGFRRSITTAKSFVHWKFPTGKLRYGIFRGSNLPLMPKPDMPLAS